MPGYGYRLTHLSLITLFVVALLCASPMSSAMAQEATDVQEVDVSPAASDSAAPSAPAQTVQAEQKEFTPVQLEPVISPMDEENLPPSAVPPGEILQSLNGQEAGVPVPQQVQQVAPTQAHPVVPGLPDEDLFYDANSLIPQGEIGQRAGPRKLDPRNQPASSLVIVTDKQGSDSVNAQLVAAQRAQALGLYDSAAQIYEELYKKNKRDDRILMGRAVVFQHMGRFDEAIQAYQTLLDKSPKNKEAQINMLGLMTEKYPSVALRRLLDMEEEQGKSAALAAQIAVAYAKLGNFNEALSYLGVASSMEPDNAAHVFNIAVIADRGGNIGMAKTYYERALDVDSANGTAEGVPRDIIYERLAKLR